MDSFSGGAGGLQAWLDQEARRHRLSGALVSAFTYVGLAG